jgi:hypothetical protein
VVVLGAIALFASAATAGSLPEPSELAFAAGALVVAGLQRRILALGSRG